MKVVKIKELNNKSRKGLYVYIKNEGNVGRYYKIDSPMENLKPYEVHYNKKYMKKESSKLGEIKKYYQDKKPIAEHKTKYGRRSIKSVFKKGISKIKISDVHRIDNITVNKKNKELLSKIVKDQDILNILIQNENLNKLKFRFNHILSFKDEDGKIIGQDTIIGKMTLNEIIAIIQNNVMKGEVIEGSQGWKRINDRINTNIKDGKEGTIENVEVITTFTIGKGV